MKKRVLTPMAAAIILAVGFLYNFYGIEKDQISKPGLHTEDVVEAPKELTENRDEGMAPNKYINAVVTKVVDGDTVDIDYKGKKYKVRLLCVDTPESVKQGVDIQPYGKEASELLKSRVLGKKVKLVFEKGLRDRYSRLLAHVITEDQNHINSMLIKNGYARVEIVSPNRAYKDYFYKLQETAISAQKGFWGLPEEKRPFVKNNKGIYVPKYQNAKKAS